MDYPLQYTDSTHHPSPNSATNYRTYPMFDERSDISSSMFDDGSSPTAETEDPSSSIMLLSTRPSHSMQGPWNRPQPHPHHHSPLLNSDYRPMQHQQMQQKAPHSERGIAGFVSKLYQCLQSVESSRKYARWCQHEGKDMFIIDCIPEFTEFVLPRLFKHCKFPSFVRQLNIYGFQRDTDARKSKDTKDKESCRWYHPCFQPGRRDLFHLIRRKATRYSRKRKVKASDDEDPETILNLGSADESDVDEEGMVLLVNNDGRRRSSSASSAPIDYNAPPLGLLEPVTATTNSSPTNRTNEEYITRALLLQPDDQADENGLVLDMHHFEQKPPHQPLMRGQELGLKLYDMKQHYEKTHAYFNEQLNAAQIQIEEQQIRIQQLEDALGITKHSVKQGTATGGYSGTMNTMPNYSMQQNSVIIPSMYPIKTNSTAAPRPSHFYFHENASSSSGSTNNNSIDHANDPKVIGQIKNEIVSSPSTPSNNWLPYHRDSSSSVAISSPNSNRMLLVTAGSDIHHSSPTHHHHTGRDSHHITTSKPVAELPSSTPPKVDLMGHMNFNTYI